MAHTRVVERRGPACPVKNHQVGERLFLWEILPERAAESVDDPNDIEWC